MSTKNGILKNLMKIVIVFTMCISAILSTSKSIAASLTNWRQEVRSYSAGYGYVVNGAYENRWLMYDNAKPQVYKDIYCIRSGDRQNKEYDEIDLYNISQEEKSKLFRNETDYKHFMWLMENMYLYGENNTNKLENFRKLIGASSFPYSSTQTDSFNLHEQDGGRLSGEKITISLNEHIIKVVQNEIMCQLVKQSKDRSTNFTSGLYSNGSKVSAEVNEFANKIILSLLNDSNKYANYSVNNKNKNFGKSNYDGNVTIKSSNTDADWNNGYSGRFTVNNKYKAGVSGFKVYLNGKQLSTSEYSIINMSGNNITSDINNILTNSASTNAYEFRVKYNGKLSDTDKIKVDFNVNYGYITKATLLKPKTETTNGDINQYLINTSRELKTATVSSEQNVVIIKAFDMALTKEITSVSYPNGSKRTEDDIYERFKEADIYGLKNNTSTTARYIMDKSLVYAENGSRVVYKITVYNEGERDGYAKEIKDYLPKGLELAPDSEINTKYGWTLIGDGIVKTSYLANTKINAFNGTTLSSNYVEIECVVKLDTEGLDALKRNNKYELDNKAEISSYGYYDNSGSYIEASSKGKDRDSIQNNVLLGGISKDTLIGQIKTKFESEKNNGLISFNSVIDKAILAAEDDDDIERLEIRSSAKLFDLALRKWIVSVNNTAVNREPSQVLDFTKNIKPIVSTYALRFGTLNYDNPKEAVIVKKGDLVTYRIGIFNEGSADGYANEITDYLPAGLEFVTDNATNTANGWTATKQSDGTTIVKTTKFAKNDSSATTLQNKFGYTYDMDPSETTNIICTIPRVVLERDVRKTTNLNAYKYIDIVCRVTNDATTKTYLSNRAEITDYGYYLYESNGTPISIKANVEGNDRDSIQNTIKNNLNLKNWYVEHFDPINPVDYFAGEQDDDDFETVFVDEGYGIQLQKECEENTKYNKGVTVSFNINNNKVNKTTDDNGYTEVVTIPNDLSEDKILIKEESVGDWPLAKLNETFELRVKKETGLLDKNKFISFYFGISGAAKEYKLSETASVTVVDSNNNKVTVKAYFDHDANTFKIVMPNHTIKSFDLALRKWIIGVNDVELKNSDGSYGREPSQIKELAENPKQTIKTELMKEGFSTLDYDNPKEAITVKKGDLVKYRIAVVNEGDRVGYANEITDYLPAGLEYVDNSFNRNNGWTATKQSDGTTIITTTKFAREKGSVLNGNSELQKYADIYLSKYDTSNALINILQYILNKDVDSTKTKMKPYLYVDVICKVTDNAVKGNIYTNRAEITKYGYYIYDENGNATYFEASSNGTDRDSVQNTIRSNLNLNTWYKNSYSESKTTFPGEQDDDDFETVIVDTGYEFEIVKRSAYDQNNIIKEARFAITCTLEDVYDRHFAGTGVSVGDEAFIATGDVIQSGIIYEPVSEDIFTIRESYVRDTDYILVDTIFELRVSRGEGLSGMNKITGYSFAKKGDQPKYVNLSQSVPVNTKDREGNDVIVTARFDSSKNRFIIDFPNNIKSTNYKLKLLKKSKTTDKIIQGIDFAINTKSEVFKTDANGMVNFGEYPINKDNYLKIDEYTISEISNSNNLSKRYYLLSENIKLYVKKRVIQTTENGQKVDKYEVESISFDGTNFGTSKSKTVALSGSNQTVTITGSVTGNEITLTVPNIEKYGAYSLLIQKEDEKGNILSKEGLFSLEGIHDAELKYGVYHVLSNEPITPTSVNTPETYSIIENGTIEGYSGLLNPIKVTINKEDTGSDFVVKYVDVECGSGKNIRVNRNESKKLTGVKLKNGTTVDLNIDLTRGNGNTILITVPNNKLNGKYNLEIFKHESGTTNGISGISFDFKKEGKYYTQRTTNQNGIAKVNDIPISALGEQTYTIDELQNANPKYIGLAESLTVKVKTTKTANGNYFIASDAYFENGSKTKTVKLLNGKNATVKISLKSNETGENVNTISLDIENPRIKGNYRITIHKIEWDTMGKDIPNVSFKVNSNTTPFTTGANGKVEIVNKNITTDNLNSVDEYIIKEISVDSNKYIKIKNNLIITVSKGINKEGEEGTENAPNTRYVINNIALRTDGENPVYTQGKNAVLLEGVELEDNSVVDVYARIEEETDANGDKYQNLVIDVPNKPLEGKYALYIKKINASKENEPIKFAKFNVRANVSNETKEFNDLSRSNEKGLIKVGNDFSINKFNYWYIDTFTITEVGIYNDESGTDVNNSYIKLKKPVILSIKKSENGYRYIVSEIYLEQEGSTQVSGTSSVTLPNVLLENGDKVDIVVTNKKSQLNHDLSEVTVQIPNKEADGSYSLSLHKTLNGSNVSGVQFKLSNLGTSKMTDSNGNIVVFNGQIDINNYNRPDIYEITEVDNKDDSMLSLVNPFIITVEKGIVNNKFVVNKVTIVNGTQTKIITRGAGTNTANTVTFTGLATADSSVKMNASVVLDETNSSINVNIDNPTIRGDYNLKLFKVDSKDKSKLSGAVFSITDGSSTFERTTRSDGYAYIYGDDPTTTSVTEPKKQILETRKDTIIITEKTAKPGYELPEYIKIVLTIGKKKNLFGTRYILDPDTTSFDVGTTSEFSSVTDAAIKTKVGEQIAALKSGIKLDIQDSELSITMPNDRVKGSYTLDIFKVKYNANVAVEEKVNEQLPFTVNKNGTYIVRSEMTNSDGIVNVGTSVIDGENVDTYTIEEDVKYGSGYIRLNEPIVVKVETGLNDAKTAFVLKKAYIYDSNNTASKNTTKQVTLADGTSAIAKVRIEGTNVRVVIPNKQITGKYSLRFRKTENTTSGAGISGVKFKINGTVQNDTDSNGYITYWTDHAITSETLDDEVFTIQEITLGSANENKYVKLKSPLELTLSKGLNESKTEYVITNMKLKGEGLTTSKSASSATNLILQNIALTDGRTVTVQAKLEGTTVTVIVPNRSITGSYNLKIRKIDSITKSGIPNVTFNIKATINDVVTLFSTGSTNENGYVDNSSKTEIAKTVEILNNALNSTDSYEISEIIIDNSYCKLKNSIKLLVNKEVEGGKYVVSNISLVQGENSTSESNKSVTLTGVALSDNSVVDITASLNEDKNEIVLTIPNKPMQGQYNLKLIKYDNDFANTKQGAQFIVTTNNGVSKGIKTETTNASGEIVLTPSAYTITKDNVEITDVYEITERTSISNEYLKLNEKLQVKVTKKKDTTNNKYVIDTVTLLKESGGSVSVSKSGSENDVTLSGIRTNNASVTAKAKLLVDKTNDIISIKIENPKVTGEYQLKIRKVDSVTGAVLANVKLGVTKPDRTTTEVTTTTSYMGTKVGSAYAINTLIDDNWVIKENETTGNYYLLGDFAILLKVKKGLSADGTKYIVKEVVPTISKTGVSGANSQYDASFQKMLEAGTKVAINSDGTEIVLEIPNEKSTNYNFELRKIDEKGNPLTDARFTIVKPDGTNMLTNQYLDAGGVIKRQIDNVKADSNYYFDIIENDGASKHINTIEGFKLRVQVAINKAGNIDQDNTFISEVIAIDDSMSSSEKLARKAEIYSRIYKREINVLFGSTNRSNDTVILQIQNPYDLKKFNLSLVKEERGTTNTLSGAEFEVIESGTSRSETTDSNGTFVIADKTDLEYDVKYTYTVKETKAPGSFVKETNEAVIEAGINSNGKSYAVIKTIKYNNSETGETVNRAYNETLDSSFVRIENAGDDNFKVHWYNRTQFHLRLYKREYTSSKYDMISYPILDSTSGAEFTVYEQINGNASTKKQISELNRSYAMYHNRNAKADTLYTYIIDETSIPTGYEADFENVYIMVDIRINNEGAIAPVSTYNNGSRIYVQAKPGKTLTSEEYSSLNSRLSLVIDDRLNEAIINIANIKIEEKPDVYDIELIKVDKYNNERTLSGVEFGVWCNGNVKKYQEKDSSGNLIGTATNPTTNSEGIAKIIDIPFAATTTDTIRITELKAPYGYKILSGVEITVLINKTGLSNSSEITSNNITVSVGGSNAAMLPASSIKCRVINGRIQIVIPNEPFGYRFVLRKTDMTNNIIYDDVDSNGITSNAVFDVKEQASDGTESYLYRSTKVKDGRLMFYKVGTPSTSGTMDTYIISEISPKTGYTNILQGYKVYVYVSTGSTGVINASVGAISSNQTPTTTCFKVVRTAGATFYSQSEIESMLNLEVKNNGDSYADVEFSVKNPVRFKVRLRKTDTSARSKPIDSANMTISRSLNDGAETKLAEMNATTGDKQTQIETDYIEINSRDYNKIIVRELSVHGPYYNIFENKRIVIAFNENKEKINYTYKIYNENGAIDTSDTIYNYVELNLIATPEGNIIDIKVRNPITYKFQLRKTNFNNQEITTANFTVNGIPNLEGKEYKGNITITETGLNPGDIKEYRIEETSVSEPYYNIIPYQTLILKLQVQDDGSAAVCYKGYIENGVTHEGWGPYEKYLYFRTDVDSKTGINTYTLRLINPVKYQIKVFKGDMNNNGNKGSDFELEHNETVIRETSVPTITGEYVQNTTLTTVKVRENASAPGFINVFEGKELEFGLRFTDKQIEIFRTKLNDIYDKDNSITGFGDLAQYVNYYYRDDGNIPTVWIYLKNPVKYNLNVIKQTTDGNDYDGAVFEIKELNNGNKITKNTDDSSCLSRINLSNLDIKPGSTIQYVIKETSTTTPHTNILSGKEIRLDVYLSKNNSSGELTFETSYTIVNSSTGQTVTDENITQFISVVPSTTSDEHFVNVYIKNPIKYELQFDKVDYNGNPITGKAKITINGISSTEGSANYVYNYGSINKQVTFEISETETQDPFVNVLENYSVIINSRINENEKLQYINMLCRDTRTGKIVTMPESIKESISVVAGVNTNGIPTLYVKLKNPMKYSVKFNKLDMNNNPLNGATMKAVSGTQTYTNTNNNYTFGLDVTNVGKGSVNMIKFTEVDAPGTNTYVNVLDGKTIGLIFAVGNDYSVNLVRVFDLATNTTIQNKYIKTEFDSSTYTFNINIQNPVEYDFEIVKVDLNGQEISGNDLVFKVTKEGKGGFIKTNNGGSTISFAEKDMSAGISHTYTIEEIMTKKPYQNVLENKKFKLTVGVGNDGEPRIEQFELQDSNGNVVENKYVKYSASLVSSEGRRLIQVRIQNPLKYKVKVVKTDMSDNPVTYANVYIDGASNRIGETNFIQISKNDVAHGQVNSYTVYEANTSKPYINVLGDRKLKFDIQMNYDNTISVVNVNTYTGTNTTPTNYGLAEDLLPYITWDYETEEGTEVPIVVIKIKNPIQYGLKLIKVDEHGNGIKGANLIMNVANRVIGWGDSVVEQSIISTGKTDRVVISETNSPYGYQNPLVNKFITFDVKESNGRISVEKLLVEDSKGVINLQDYVALKNYFSYEIINEQGIPTIVMNLKNPVEYDFRLYKQTTNGLQLSGTSLKMIRVDDNGNEIKTLTNVENGKMKSYIFNDKINIKPNETQIYYIKEDSSTSPYVNILKDKLVRITISLNKVDENGRCELRYMHAICDKDGNELRGDSAINYISFDCVKDSETGKYTLNMYLKNPISVKFEFKKVDMKNNPIVGKTTITVNGVENNGEYEKIFEGISAGEELIYVIGETNAQKPLQNILGDRKIKIYAYVNNDERLGVKAVKLIDSDGVEKEIPEEVSKYFKYEISRNEQHIDVLSVTLKNPIQFKVRIAKINMLGGAIGGSEITATYNDTEYIMPTIGNFVTIPVTGISVDEVARITVDEYKASENYTNVFKGKRLVFDLKVDGTGSIVADDIFMVDTSRNTREEIPEIYYETIFEGIEDEGDILEATIKLKNPIKYNFEVVKEDLAGREIYGKDLVLNVSVDNQEKPTSNLGGSRVKIVQDDGFPINKHTYRIEELSAAGPFKNIFDNKVIIAVVETDRSGKVSVTKFDVVDKETGEILDPNDYRKYVSFDQDQRDSDGTKLIKVTMKNPITYNIKVVKTRANTSDRYTGASIEIDEVKDGTNVVEIQNEEGTSEVTHQVNDVVIGEERTFIIKENSTSGAHINLLENKKIEITTLMAEDKNIKITGEFLIDEITGEKLPITDDMKETYRFNYRIKSEADYQTLLVTIENPIKFNIKLVKQDASGVDLLTGTSLELIRDGMIVADNKDTGDAVIEYTQYDAASGDTFRFTVQENSSVKPNINYLKDKAIDVEFEITKDERINIINTVERGIFGNNITNPSEFVVTRVERIDGIQTLIIELINPVEYDIDLVKNVAGLGFINNSKFEVYREDYKLFDDYVTEKAIWNKAEITETNMLAGQYTYYITEKETPGERYVNILKDKYIKLRVEVSGTGVVKIKDNKWMDNSSYFEIFEGNIADRKSEDKKIADTDLLYKYINVKSIKEDSDYKYTVEVDVTNPIKYLVEVNKVDAIDNPLEGAKFEIESSVIENNGKDKIDETKIIGSDVTISDDGKVTGNTSNDGKLGYEETFVKVGTHEYILKEIETPGEQYINPFKGYKIHFKVEVDSKGNLTLGMYQNNKNVFIEKNGMEIEDIYYEYISLNADNGLIVAKLQIDVENPVKYKFEVRKEIYGEDNLTLSGVKFEIESSLIKEQHARFEDKKQKLGNYVVYTNGVVLGTTNEQGLIAFEEYMAKPGIYEYWISEIETNDENIINMLQHKYIKVYVRVNSNGSVELVSEDGQLIDKAFYIYESDKTTKVDFADTGIDELINVNVTNQNGLYTAHVVIDNPQKYDLRIIKTDKDTMENLNGVTFDVKAYKGETNNDGQEILTEIGFISADDIAQKISAKGLVTANVKNIDGIIEIKNIAYVGTGAYYFEFIETTPIEPTIYKDKSENVIVKVNVGIENGKYKFNSIEVVQGEQYVLVNNTKVENGLVITNITNERVKGSYELDLSKISETLGTPLKGAEFIIEAYEVNNSSQAQSDTEDKNELIKIEKGEGQLILYKATDDVNSKEQLIPGKMIIRNDDGIFKISNIRIDNLKPYILKITETKAPEEYTVLKDPIEILVTPTIKGEADNAEYIIDTAEIISGNNSGLVMLSAQEKVIGLDIKNEQFDLALRKHISSINGKDISRWTEPEIDVTNLITNKGTTAEYYNSKIPLKILAGQEIIYTLRVYNEGQIDGYASEIVDYLPEELEFLSQDEFNKSRGWEYVNYEESERVIRTNYLSKEVDKEGNVIKAFNKETGEISYVEVEVKCKVKETATANKYATNIAEISKYEGYDRENVVDRDSKDKVIIPSDNELPFYKDDEIGESYVPGQEDDDDFEKIIVGVYDLSLRKFITKVNEKALEGNLSREPVVDTTKLINGEATTAEYKHTKEPVEVAHENTVEYTIRVYNEGSVDGYASLVKDNIPEGLVFIPNNETNVEYKWKMLDENGEEIKDPKSAKYIVTDYLSMENGSKEDENIDKSDESSQTHNGNTNKNLIKAFNKENMTQLDYRDVKVVFMVDVPGKSDNIIINEAQISDNQDENGEAVKDRDSQPDKWVEGEDDQDKEYLKVMYFDLALNKWVSRVIVNEKGKQTVTETGHTGAEDPEPAVKVDIPKESLNTINVKFEYQIRVINEGVIPGYVKEISDYIPEGLRFVQEDNPNWKVVDDKVVNSELSDTLLQPGETATVKIVLTWINSANNLGLKVNTAEISEDYNNYGDSKDIDSTPNNIVSGEDDIDIAPVVLAVRTGEIPTHIVVYIIAVGIVLAGAVGISIYMRKH